MLTPLKKSYDKPSVQFSHSVMSDSLRPYDPQYTRPLCPSPTPGVSNKTREDSIHGHHQMANTEIRLIIFFAAKDRKALYSQQKQDWEPTVA